jgi:hypothetical protein
MRQYEINGIAAKNDCFVPDAAGAVVRARISANSRVSG